MENWYEINKLNDHLYIIRERLDKIDHRFHTKFTNLFLILGENSAILFDSGCGIYDFTGLIRPILQNRELMVINSHNHFDHIGGNRFFDEVYIHHLDLNRLVKPMDISFLKSNLPEINDVLQRLNYLLPATKEHKILAGGEKFNLGGIKVEVIFTPGHTPGSISLLSDKDEIFVGDLLSYGAVYLPSKDNMYLYNASLESISKRFSDKTITVYPSHEEYNISTSIITELLEILSDDKIFSSDQRVYDDFLDAWILEVDKFLLVYPKE